MQIENRKKWKARLISAALHVQGWPVFFGGTTFSAFMRLSNPIKESAELYKTAALKAGFNHLQSGDPIYETARAMAKKSNIRLINVFMKESLPFCNASIQSSEKVGMLYCAGNPQNIPEYGQGILENVIGHELTHAKRDSSGPNLVSKVNFVLSIPMLPIYGLAYARSGLEATLVAGGAALSALISLPVLRHMYRRNEEYLADIGAVDITGKPLDAIITFRYLEALHDLDRSVPQKTHSFRDRVPDYHPSFEKRRDVLCEVFNISTEDRAKAEDIGLRLAQAMVMGPPCPPGLKETNLTV